MSFRDRRSLQDSIGFLTLASAVLVQPDLGRTPRAHLRYRRRGEDVDDLSARQQHHRDEVGAGRKRGATT